MARIPLQSLVSARQSGIAVQPGVFQQTADATAGLLSSVAGGVEMVKQQFDRAQDIHNQSEISEKRRMFRDAQGEFQNRMLEKDFHPSEWGPEWIKTLEEVERDVDFNGKDMAPVVQRALLEDFENFAGSSLIEISGSALKENLKRGKENYLRDDEYLKSIRDHKGRIKLLEEQKSFDPEEKKDIARAITVDERADDMTLNMINDPLENLKKLESGGYPHLSEIARIKEIDKNKQVISNNQIVGIKDVLDELEADGFQPTKEKTREEQVKTALESNPNISAKAVKQVMAGINNAKPVTVLETQKFTDRIDALRGLRDKPGEYLEAWHNISMDVISGRSRPGMTVFNSQLGKVHPYNYTADANETRREQIAAGKLADEREPLEVFARREVAAFTKSLAEISFTEEENLLSPSEVNNAKSKDTEVKNLKLKARIEARASLLREQLQYEVNDFIRDFDGVPTSTVVQEFIRKNGDQLLVKTSMGKINKPKKGFGNTPPNYAKEIDDYLPIPRMKSKRGLGDNSKDPGIIQETTMLPPQ